MCLCGMLIRIRGGEKEWERRGEKGRVDMI